MTMRILLATIFLLSSALITNPAQAQTSGPSRPQMPAGGLNLAPSCPTPTLAQCSDGDYMYGTPCGALQRERSNSTCAILLRDGMATRANTEELGVVPPNISPSGVDYAIPTPPAGAGRYYVPDLASAHSGQAAGAYAIDDVIGIDQYADWLSNGPRVNSCREYVWERYADINEFLRLANPVRDQFRTVFNIAYGPASNRGSIGTRHLNSPTMRGRDGRPFGTLFPGTLVARNEFYRIVNFPGYSTEFPPPTDVPGLLDSLSQRSLAGGLIVGRIQAARAANTHRVAETWNWHRLMSSRFAFIPSEHIAGPQQLAANPPERGAFPLAALGQSPQPGQRRYLDAELNELWRLQQRTRELITDWKRANNRFVGSGWNVRDAGLGYPLMVIAQQPARTLTDVVRPTRRGRGVGPVQGPSQLAIPDPETVVRQRILDELLEVLTLANQYGCLNGGDSPCDWSTARFAQVLYNDFGAGQDRALDECNAFTGGNLQNVLNLDFAFIDDPEYPEFDCRVTTGSTITAVGLEQLMADVEYCRDLTNEYAAARAQDEAQARVRAIPELVDPATGEFVVPGIRRSRDELMGNEYFGLGYNYELGFEAGINAENCQIDVQAVARAFAYANVFTREVTLLDMGAEADTVERTVDIWARVASKSIFVPQELFDPISLNVAEIEPLEFNLTRDFEKVERAEGLLHDDHHRDHSAEDRSRNRRPGRRRARPHCLRRTCRQ
jgi:hypothetical protein